MSLARWSGVGSGALLSRGVEGLLRDGSREPGTPPLPADTVSRVVTLTCTEPPHEATHWSGRAMAKAAGISLRSVQRIWHAHKPEPHRIRTLKRSRDPNFEAKPNNIVWLYMDPPAHTAVLSLDEKSQIQTLDRTAPGLPPASPALRLTCGRSPARFTALLISALSNGGIVGCVPPI